MVGVMVFAMVVEMVEKMDFQGAENWGEQKAATRVGRKVWR